MQSGNNVTGTDPTLGWSIKIIKGIFIHGFLQGQAIIGLQDGRWLLASIEDGVMHGPQILHGVLQILPVIINFVEFFIAYKLRRRKCCIFRPAKSWSKVTLSSLFNVSELSLRKMYAR